MSRLRVLQPSSQPTRRPLRQRCGWNARLSLLPMGALLGEALHYLVASAMLRYLVHCLPKQSSGLDVWVKSYGVV